MNLTLCLCGHAAHEHALEQRGTGQCKVRRCRCLRFTEAPFDRQQMPLFEEGQCG